ncbi:MAG: BrnT family toxin [Candidatus Eisenbacteria bacterium]|nr:BrnT family toxin [Candidatus Eisenbacteria bacterium]
MPPPPEYFEGITGFQWDEGNSDKNWRRHQVNRAEAEQVFFNLPLVVVEDKQHSSGEQRYFALGRTDADRKLMIVFTLRNDLLRVISARTMSRRERSAYAKAVEA